MLGLNRTFSPYTAVTPALRAARTIASASAALRASGFSIRNGLPARMQASAASWCREFGSVMSTQSTAGSLMTASMSDDQRVAGLLAAMVPADREAIIETGTPSTS
jgi:hypothetical protein